MSIILNGGSTFNWFTVSNKVETDVELALYANSDTNLEWDLNKILVATFEDKNLQAGNVDNLTELISDWKIYRRKTDETINHLVGTTDVEVTNIRDYMVSNNNTYIYTIYPLTESYVGTPMVSNELTTDFWYYSLTDMIIKEVWLFYLNTDSGTNSININSTIVTGNTQYPTFINGVVNYKSGTITSLIGDISSSTGEYVDTVSLRENLLDCLTNGNPKLLKNYKGDLLKVNTIPSSFAYEDKTKEQIQTIVFDWFEIGSIDDLSLYDEITS